MSTCDYKKLENPDEHKDQEQLVVIQESKKEDSKYQNFLIAVMVMMLSVIFTSLSTFLVKFAYMENKELNGFDYMIAKTPIVILTTFVQAWMLKVNIFRVESEGRFWLAIRCLLGVIAMPCFFVGLKYLPSSKATFIRNLQPVMVSIAAFLCLKEKITKADIVAVFGAFAGVILMNYQKTNSSKIDSSYDLVILGITLCVITSILGSGSTIAIRIMNQRIHYMLNAAYFAYSLFIVALILVVVKPSLFHFETYSFRDVFWMALSGLTHYVGQTLNSLAYKYEEASKITPFSYTGGMFLMIADIIIFRYDFHFTDILGILFVFCSLLFPIIVKGYYKEAKNKKKD